MQGREDLESKLLDLKFGFLHGWPWAAAPLGIKAHPACPLFHPIMKRNVGSDNPQAHSEWSINANSYTVFIFVFIRQIPREIMLKHVGEIDEIKLGNIWGLLTSGDHLLLMGYSCEQIIYFGE